MWAKPLGIVSGLAAAAVLGGTAMAASSIPITVTNGVVSINGHAWQAQNTGVSGSYTIQVASEVKSVDPPGTNSLTSQPEGSLTITRHTSDYVATWTWSGLTVRQEVMLVGDQGSGPVSLSSKPETLLFGTVKKAGIAVIDIPFSDYKATKQNPETFEAFALFSSTPTGQMPEVPVAAALPLAGLAVGGFALYRRRALGT